MQLQIPGLALRRLTLSRQFVARRAGGAYALLRLNISLAICLSIYAKRQCGKRQ